MFLKLLKYIGLVPLSDLKNAQKQIDFIIDRIELKRNFVVINNDEIYSRNKIEDTDVIVRGSRNLLNENTFINSMIITTYKCDNLMVSNNLFKGEV